MQIAVLVEPMNGKGFRATSTQAFDISSEGPTREDALRMLRAALDARLRAGAEVVALEIGTTEHPLLKYAGILKDNPLLDDWKCAMAEYRDQIEKDDDYP